MSGGFLPSAVLRLQLSCVASCRRRTMWLEFGSLIASAFWKETQSGWIIRISDHWRVLLLWTFYSKSRRS